MQIFFALELNTALALEVLLFGHLAAHARRKQRDEEDTAY